MTELQNSPQPTDDQAEDLTCAFCHQAIYDAYFEVNGQTSCQKCRYTVEEQRARGSGAVRFLRAFLAGGLAAALGAGIYYAVLAATDYEFALVSILVGLMVGFAVSWGSGHRGGRVYQSLAVVLTYFAIVSTYVPFLLEAWDDGIEAEAVLIEGDGNAGVPASAEALGAQPVTLSVGEAATGLIAFAVLVAAMPFLAGVENVLGLLIIGFGLFEAWRLNQFVPLTIEGPFRFGKVSAGEGR